MKKSRGMSPFPIPIVLAATAGIAIGIGAYAFDYAKGSSYLGNDPATCANCHVMVPYYDGWQAGVHKNVATCNDCHTPAFPISKYIVKATNGYHHSMAFTLGNFPANIKARPESARIVEDNCRRCHANLVEDIAHGRDVSCVRCHRSVGHLR